MLNDRLRIATGAVSGEVVLAPQVILNCDTTNDGCHGGDPATLLKWISTNGVPDETCMRYMATGHDVGATCNAIDVCRTCTPDGDCSAVTNFKKVSVSEYGSLSGEADMIKELQRGPIVCNIAVTDALLAYTGGIFRDTTGDVDIDHSISVVGYGEENGVKYWVVRNRCAASEQIERAG